MQFIVKFSKNVNFFDLTLNDSLNKNVNIMFVNWYIYYRDVFFFINKLKNLKKKFSISKSKNTFLIVLKTKHKNKYLTS